ncbi:unnamed protein product [Symbiodinium sp. CCMP2592]|nr:unnamed protein product [Symbiodinium sp. CCMP2592]
MESTEWTIVHVERPWKGRTEPLKLLLEDAGVPYAVRCEELGPAISFDLWRGSEAAITVDSTPFPVMFPPAIWHRPHDGEEVFVNTQIACMRYLGQCLGYAPSSAAEGARADQIAQNAVDYWVEGRVCFHPLDSSHLGSYSSQKEAAEKSSQEWSRTRMRLWLQHFEKVVSRDPGPRKPCAGGASVTFADFLLFHVLDATEAQFNSEHFSFAWDAAGCEGLKAYKAPLLGRSRASSTGVSTILIIYIYIHTVCAYLDICLCLCVYMYIYI